VWTHSKAPVHAEVDGNYDELIGEQIDLLCPAADRLMATRYQLWIEERAETVDFGHVALAATVH